LPSAGQLPDQQAQHQVLHGHGRQVAPI
jgi:hypothetical protein